MGLFSSPREEQAPGLYKNQMRDYDTLYKNILASRSSFEDVNTLGDVSNRFGLKQFDRKGYNDQVAGVYDPLAKNIATQSAQARKRAASAYGVQGTPGFAGTSADAAFAGERANLASQRGSALLGGFDKETDSNRFNAGFLSNVLQNKDQFRQGKYGAQAGVLGGKTGAINGYLGALSGNSVFDDILAAGGTAAKFGKAFA